MARFEVPDGWTAQAYRFALDPSPSQVGVLESHCGAARFAFNHMLDVVKNNLDQRAAERSYGIRGQELTPAQGWSLPKLRKRWNQVKDEVAPWWEANSKEAYNSGLDALARALGNWAASRSGERAGATVGFPRYKSKHSAARSVRFTTGAIRVEPDRHHVVFYCCRDGCPPIDRDLNAAINLARLSDTPTGGAGEMGTGTGSRPAANRWVGDGRGANQKTSPTTEVVGTAGGDETSTPHTNKTGTASSQGEAA